MITLKQLLDNTELDGFTFEWADEFTPYSALIDACPEINKIVIRNDKKGERALDYDELFDTVIGFIWDIDDTFDNLRDKYTINDDILYSKLAVDGIYANEQYGGLIIKVSYID